MTTDDTRAALREQAYKIAESNLIMLKHRELGININTYVEILAHDIEQLIDRYSSERAVEARIDELKKLNNSDTWHFMTSSAGAKYISERLGELVAQKAALTPKAKGAQ